VAERCGYRSGLTDVDVNEALAEKSTHPAMLTPAGTTGPPKAIHHTHRAYVELLDRVLVPLRAGRRPPQGSPPNLIPVSLALNAGLYNALFGLRAGTGLVMMDHFDPDAFALLVRRFGVRSTVLPPAAKTHFRRSWSPHGPSLTVGGGVRTLDDIKTLLRSGADKVAKVSNFANGQQLRVLEAVPAEVRFPGGREQVEGLEIELPGQLLCPRDEKRADTLAAIVGVDGHAPQEAVVAGVDLARRENNPQVEPEHECRGKQHRLRPAVFCGTPLEPSTAHRVIDLSRNRLARDPRRGPRAGRKVETSAIAPPRTE